MGKNRSLPEEELNHYWNALVADPYGATPATDSLDPATAETIRGLAHLGAVPAPATSRERVRRGIRDQLRLHGLVEAEGRNLTLPAQMRPLHTQHPSAVELIVHGPLGADLAQASALPINGRVQHAATSGNGWTSVSPLSAPPSSLSTPLSRVYALTRAAAAIVLVVVVVSAMIALLYPHRLGGIGEQVLIAGSDTATVETALTGETTLLALTLTDFPTYLADLDIFLVTLPPGSQSELRSGAGPKMFYVAEGPVTVRATTAPEPLEAIPPQSASAPPPRALIAQGEQATIEMGTTLLAPAGAEFDLFTAGPATARLVDLFSATDSRGNGEGVTIQAASNGGMIVSLSAPVSITLRQGSLAPGATLPAPASEATRQVVATRESSAIGALASRTSGAVRNIGEQPVDLYVLTVTTSDG